VACTIGVARAHPYRERQRAGPRRPWRPKTLRLRLRSYLENGTLRIVDRQQPIAYFITFRCYGSWLPGDARGWTDRRDNVPGTAPRPGQPRLLSTSQTVLAEGPFNLGRERRRVVDRAIRDVCEHRAWTLHALNVRTNHVHLVVTAASVPERVMTTLKAWSTRRLREANLLEVKGRAWSRHGSTKYLWTTENVETACRYVSEEQGSDLP
jgi:REP element-mobilizing transposase RayT